MTDYTQRIAFGEKYILPTFRQCLVCYSTDEKVRYNAASGGIVTQITKYMFEKGNISTAINFKYDKEYFFKPYLIYSFDEYKQVGSIYQDIALPVFLKDNINNIKGNILVTCLPCQVKAIKHLLQNNKKEFFIIALVCSGQTSKEGTKYVLDLLNLPRHKVASLRYRCAGWPNNLFEIVTVDGKILKPLEKKGANLYTSIPFSLRRCVFCRDGFGIEADVCAADAWLSRYKQNDKIGVSEIGIISERASDLIAQMQENGSIHIEEVIDQDEFFASQPAINLKNICSYTEKNYESVRRLLSSRLYQNFILKNLSFCHRFFLAIIRRMARIDRRWVKYINSIKKA